MFSRVSWNFWGHIGHIIPLHAAELPGFKKETQLGMMDGKGAAQHHWHVYAFSCIFPYFPYSWFMKFQFRTTQNPCHSSLQMDPAGVTYSTEPWSSTIDHVGQCWDPDIQRPKAWGIFCPTQIILRLVLTCLFKTKFKLRHNRTQPTLESFKANLIPTTDHVDCVCVCAVLVRRSRFMTAVVPRSSLRLLSDATNNLCSILNLAKDLWNRGRFFHRSHGKYFFGGGFYKTPWLECQRWAQATSVQRAWDP